MRVQDATLKLSAQSTADDVATQGDESPWLSRYLADNTIASGDAPAEAFRVPTP